MYTYEIDYLIKDERGGRYILTVEILLDALDTEKALDEFIQLTEQPTDTIVEIKVYNPINDLIDIIN